MRIFRKNFLRKEEIGIIPPGGYRFKQSITQRQGIQWLILKEREIERSIIRGMRGRISVNERHTRRVLRV